VTDDLQAGSIEHLTIELERSRESSARLLYNLGQKIAASRTVRSAAAGVQHAADYVHEHGWRGMASGVGRAVRKRPGTAIMIAAAAGFLLASLARSRFDRERGGRRAVQYPNRP